MTHALPLLDSYGRVHSSLRLSVTDRCNIRCFYCMPEESVRFLPRKDVLTFEEMVRLVRCLVGLGVDRVRITGGEPLVREQLPTLVRMLKELDGIREVAMTTNGVLLDRYAAELKQAGLDRLNVSLDSLDAEVFQKITRRNVLDRVLAGIEAACDEGLPIRLNALAIRGMTESEIVPLAEFALAREFPLRFIEFMPLDFDRKWQSEQVLSAEEILQIIQRRFGSVTPVQRDDPSQPAQDFLYADGRGRLGIIHSVTQPFCAQCNRIRLTAEGKLRNCLFSTEEWDLKKLLRSGEDDTAIGSVVRQCVAAKWAGHNIGDQQYQYPDKSMHQIGG